MLAGIITVSCVNNQPEAEEVVSAVRNERYSLKAVDTLEFYNSELPFDVPMQTATIEGESYITASDFGSNRLLFYSPKVDTVVVSLSLEEEGPNGVGISSYIHPVSWDSIFTAQYHTNNLYLVDSSGTVKRKWQLDQTVVGDKVHSIYATPIYNPIGYHNSKVYIQNIPQVEFTTNEFYEGSPELRFELHDQRLTSFGMWPEVYRQGIFFGIWSFNINRIITNDGTVVYSFPMSDQLYVYHDTTSVKSYAVPSTHVKESAPEPPVKLSSGDPAQDIAYEVQRASYRYLRYDVVHDYIIRVIVHAAELYDQEGNMTEFFDKPFSVQIIDKGNNYALLEEMDFPGNTYNFRNVFCVDGQIIISMNQRNNPSLEEDYFKFEVFKMVPIIS